MNVYVWLLLSLMLNVILLVAFIYIGTRIKLLEEIVETQANLIADLYTEVEILSNGRVTHP